MKSIMLVNLPADDIRDNSFPLGLSYIAASLSSYYVEIADLNLISENTFFTMVCKEHHDIIGISCYTGSFSIASDLAKKIKEIDSQCLIAIGGYHATAEFDYILNNYKEFDIAILGRGEIPLLELVKAIENGTSFEKVPSILYRKDNNVIRTNQVKMSLYDNLIPERKNESDYFSLSTGDEKISCISTMRGCCHNCYFCSISNNEKQSFTLIDAIERDIENIVKNGGNSLYFVNPDFLSNRAHVENTISVLDKYKEKIRSFKISTRADSILRNADLLETIFRLGCNSIEVGIESFSDTQLKRYNKQVTADINIKSYYEIMKFKDMYSFRYVHELIPFDPWVTRSELSKTLEFYAYNSFDYLELEPWLFVKLILYPNTMLRKRAESESIISFSHIETPFWNFVNEDVKKIYSALMKYKMVVLPIVKELRKLIRRLMDSNDISIHHKVIALKIRDKLAIITVSFLCELLDKNVLEYDSIVDNVLNTVNKYNDIIRRESVNQ